MSYDFNSIINSLVSGRNRAALNNAFSDMIAQKREDYFLSKVSAARVSKAQDGEAVLRWGEDPGYKDGKPPTGPSFNVKQSKDENKKQNKRGGSGGGGGAGEQYQLTETSRDTTTVRVENPNDSSQYVMVKRIQSITFDGPSLKSLSVRGGDTSGAQQPVSPPQGSGKAKWTFVLNGWTST